MTDDDDETEQPPHGPFRDGRLYVLDRKCATCIFRPGNLMHLQEGRRDAMVADCIADNTIIPCHKTLDDARSVCRGLYDLHYNDIPILQIADRLGLIAYDQPPEPTP
jgi:hypothetical protein